jgi:hypothetical protein
MVPKIGHEFGTVEMKARPTTLEAVLIGRIVARL